MSIAESICQQQPSLSVCVIHLTMSVERIPYSGKLLREKTFANFEVLWPFAKVFSAKFGGCDIIVDIHFHFACMQIFM